jgi:hypothetical protein
MKTAIDTWLALTLVVAAGSKVWRREVAAAAFSTYGMRGARRQRFALWLLLAVEVGLAVALLAQAAWAPISAAGLFGLFTLVAAAALLAGRRGRPCACFGSTSRLSWWTPLRSLTLTGLAVAAALNWLPDAPGGYDRWLTAALAVCLAAVVALGFVVLALAREIGVLRLGIGSQGALEITEEGPQLGTMQPWAVSLPWQQSSLLGLAIFTSDGCPLCRQLAPAIGHVAADPLLAVYGFDEIADAEVWRQASVPGSPYAVALGTDGVVAAKGTFNSLPQLESIIATARTREGVGVVVS